jgi:histidine triad (HIT) family protein
LSTCVFCAIAAGTIPATLLHRDDDVLAFQDIAPKAPVHVLVIPRKHIESLNAAEPADAELFGRMLLVCRDLASRQKVDRTGYRLVTNCGSQAGQTVAHLHFHLLGGREMEWPPG